jgi:glucose-1-phosphate adenylyltransferase
VFDENTRRGTAIDSMVAGGCIVSGATVRRTMLFSDVHIHSFSVIEDSIVLPNVVIGRNCVIKKCILDKNCVIPDGTVIGMDPQEDRKRFHVTESGITLVTRVMLGQDVSVVR